MTERMLIAVDEEESRVALVESSRLENLEIEANGGEGRRGNVYKGVIHKVEQSLQAAFVDFGEEKQGFLPLSEIHRRLWPKGITEKRPDITKLLKDKQELMVQVVKDEIGTKGATLTTYVSLPGRYLVLMPESDKHGISRRLGDRERRRLKETIDAIGVPEGFGVIIRTAGEQQRPLDLKKDLLYLTKLYETIEAKFAKRKRAGLIYKDRSHAVRFIRDYFTDSIDEVWCDNRSVLKEISEFMGVLMPGAKDKLRLYEGDAPLFIKFGIEAQIESVFARQVTLPGGGSIVIDSAEALVAVDVNSGRVKGEDIEETALKTNVEAADEIARQIKIRDLGGLLVVDFIDMRDRKNNRQVEQRLRQAFSEDKAKIKFGRISSFGLMEMSRQRLRKSLATSITRRCQTCDGTGRVRAPASAALSLLRRIEEACLRGGVKYIRATTPVGMANLLLNRRRREMTELETKLGTIVEVVAHKDMPANLVALDIVVMRKGRAAPQRIYQLLDLIRNDVIRQETSPLPKPEDGFEALEMDHTAIYRAIAQRDAELQAAEEAEAVDFEFEPREPDFSQDSVRDESDDDDSDDDRDRDRGRGRDRGRDRDRDRDRDRTRRKRKRGRRRDSDVEGQDSPPATAEQAAQSPASETAAAEVVQTPAPPPPEDLAVAARKRGGFMGWMRRIFGIGEPDTAERAEPPTETITDEVVAAAEAAAAEARGLPAPTPTEKTSDDEGGSEGSDTSAADPSRSEGAGGEDDGRGGRSRRKRRRGRRRRSDDRDEPREGGDRSEDSDGADSDQSERQGRRQGRSRSSRDKDAEDGQDQTERSREGSDEDGDGDGDSEEGRGRRRRRRRSRRRGRDRDASETTDEAGETGDGDEGTATEDVPAVDLSPDRTRRPRRSRGGGRGAAKTDEAGDGEAASAATANEVVAPPATDAAAPAEPAKTAEPAETPPAAEPAVEEAPEPEVDEAPEPDADEAPARDAEGAEPASEIPEAPEPAAEVVAETEETVAEVAAEAEEAAEAEAEPSPEAQPEPEAEDAEAVARRARAAAAAKAKAAVAAARARAKARAAAEEKAQAEAPAGDEPAD